MVYIIRDSEGLEILLKRLLILFEEHSMNKFKRLAIYFFYDKDGIVDRYIQYFLKDLRDNLDYLLIVSNGKLNSEGKIILEKYGEVLERENKGFDV